MFSTYLFPDCLALLLSEGKETDGHVIVGNSRVRRRELADCCAVPLRALMLIPPCVQIGLGKTYLNSAVLNTIMCITNYRGGQQPDEKSLETVTSQMVSP